MFQEFCDRLFQFLYVWYLYIDTDFVLSYHGTRIKK